MAADTAADPARKRLRLTRPVEIEIVISAPGFQG
jgi:hypothetical protein